jgi:hypothetical protein
MPRKVPGGLAYHVLNRANGKLRLFKKDDDYLAFEQVMSGSDRAVVRQVPRESLAGAGVISRRACPR